MGALLSTVLGAAIGVLSTPAADRGESQRSREDNEQTAKRELYADYLAALARTRNHPGSQLARAYTPEERARKAVEAFQEGNAYELRYQIALIAPANVVDASTTPFRALRDPCDLIEAGTTHTECNYLELLDHREDRFAELRTETKRDLNRVDE